MVEEHHFHQLDSRIFYENLEHILVAKEQTKLYRGDIKKIASLKKERSLFFAAKKSEKKLRELRKSLELAKARKNETAVARTEKRIKDVYVWFNKRYNEKMK